MVNRHIKRCSTLLIIRKMPIKTVTRYHFIPMRMVIIKKSSNDKCWRGFGVKRSLLHSWWECQLGQLPLWRTIWRFLKKLKTELPYDPAIPLLGIYLEKNMISNDTCTPIFIAVLFTIAKTWKQPKCPSTEEWIKQMGYTYTLKYYLAIKKNEIMPFCSNMDREIVIVSEVKSDREREKSYDILYMWHLFF